LSERLELKEGFTLRVFLALLYSAVVLTPVTLYTQLVTPVTVSTIIIFLLFVELARLLGSPLTTQEAFLIYFTAGTAMSSTLWLDLIFRAYMVESPFLEMLGIRDKVPYWWAPPLTSEVYLKRTLLHPDWMIPVSLAFISAALSLMAQISLSYLLAQLYIEIEEMPFPVAQYQADLIKNLTERSPERFRVFILSAIFGFTYGIFLYGVPMITQSIFGKSFEIPGLKLPWNDLTKYTEVFLKGAAIGIVPDILSITTAWVIPKNVIIAIAVTSILTYVVGNHIALIMPLKIFEAWQRDWFPGSDVMHIVQMSFMDLWLNPYMALNIVAGVVPFIVYRKEYAQVFKSLRVLPETLRKAGYISLTALLTMYFAAYVASLALFHILIPKFPLYLLIPFVFWEFIYAFVAGWGVATIGLAVLEPPYMREAVIIFSGYKDADIWFGPWVMAPGRGAALLLNNAFRVGYWCGCKPSSYFKALIVATVLSWVFSLLYTEMFWRMAPIPSAAYPWAAYQWPLRAIRWTFFPSIALGRVTVTVFNLELFSAGLALGVILFVVFAALKIPLSTFIGVVAGISVPPPLAISLIIGLISGYVAERIKGKEWWQKYRTAIIAGIAVGEGVIISLGGAIMLIMRSIWIAPY